MQIDINCDLGESIDLLENGHDEMLMEYVNSVNVACGYHAGNEFIMSKTIKNALKYNLKIGAHPGFNDKDNFGRLERELSRSQIIDLIHSQLEIIKSIAGDSLNHVKPHGALYNMSAYRQDFAEAIAGAIFSFDRSLILYGLSGSQSIKEAQKRGLKTYSEVFADRAYHSDGTLVSRKTEGAVLNDFEVISTQVKKFKYNQPIQAIDGKPLKLKAETICIHSDSPSALQIAKVVYNAVNGRL